MKRRTIAYLKQMKARKVIEHPLSADLNSFLKATFELSHNRIVRKHVAESLRELQSLNWHKMSA